MHEDGDQLRVATNPSTDGRGSKPLVGALNRLSETHNKNNIRTGGEEVTSRFGPIGSWNFVRHAESGRMPDIHLLELEWRAFWFESGQPEVTNPGAAFIGLCRSHDERRPNP